MAQTGGCAINWRCAYDRENTVESTKKIMPRASIFRGGETSSIKLQFQNINNTGLTIAGDL